MHSTINIHDAATFSALVTQLEQSDAESLALHAAMRATDSGERRIPIGDIGELRAAIDEMPHETAGELAMILAWRATDA